MTKNSNQRWGNKEFLDFAKTKDDWGFIQADLNVLRLKLNNWHFQKALEKSHKMTTSRAYFIDNRLFLITYMFQSEDTKFTLLVDEVIETCICSSSHYIRKRIFQN